MRWQASSSARIARLRQWSRHNLFRTWPDRFITALLGSVVIYTTFRMLRYVFVTGRWEIVRVNLKLLMVGRFPNDELWKVAVALCVLGLWGGWIAGLVLARQQRAATYVSRVVGPFARLRELGGRFWPLIVVVAILLSVSRTIGPYLTLAAVVAVATIGRVAGMAVGRSTPAWPSWLKSVMVLLLAVLPIGLMTFLAGALGWDDWGGFMINTFIAASAIALCFPLGVLLALGRRSHLPLIRAVCTGYIELFRGSPLFVLLLLANSALEFFVPSSLAPGVVVRAIIVFTLFTAAYMAEIVRGGLQSLHPGQEEAAKALGLSPARTTFFIVLPQALRNVIPAQIGQFISLFKDVSLAGAAMGVFDLLNVATSITKQTGFAGQQLDVETLAFAALLFWAVSFTMSRESQRLERKLGVGTR